MKTDISETVKIEWREGQEKPLRIFTEDPGRTGMQLIDLDRSAALRLVMFLSGHLACLMLVFVLAGCGSDSSDGPAPGPVSISLATATQADLDAWGVGNGYQAGAVNGFATWEDADDWRECVVHVKQIEEYPTLEEYHRVLGHEVDHCYRGNFHPEPAK